MKKRHVFLKKGVWMVFCGVEECKKGNPSPQAVQEGFSLSKRERTPFWGALAGLSFTCYHLLAKLKCIWWIQPGSQ